MLVGGYVYYKTNPDLFAKLTSSCPVLYCFNSGYQDSASCACVCPQNYSGNQCEISSNTINTTTPPVNTVPNQIPPTTTQPAQCLACMNSGVSDPKTCICTCVGNWQGVDCSTPIINVTPPSGSGSGSGITPPESGTTTGTGTTSTGTGTGSSTGTGTTPGTGTTVSTVWPYTPNPLLTYTISNPTSPLYVKTSTASVSGATQKLDNCSGMSSLCKWSLVPVSGQKGVYNIKSSDASLYLKGTLNAGTSLVSASMITDPSAQFRFTPGTVADTYYINTNSGYLGVTSFNQSNTVLIKSCTPGTTQGCLWMVKSV